MAYMYRYDWMVTPYINSEKEVKEEKLLGTFHKVLNYFDNFEVKRVFGEIALKVIKNFKPSNDNKFSTVINTGSNSFVLIFTTL